MIEGFIHGRILGKEPLGENINDRPPENITAGEISKYKLQQGSW